MGKKTTSKPNDLWLPKQKYVLFKPTPQESCCWTLLDPKEAIGRKLTLFLEPGKGAAKSGRANEPIKEMWSAPSFPLLLNFIKLLLINTSLLTWLKHQKGYQISSMWAGGLVSLSIPRCPCCPFFHALTWHLSDDHKRLLYLFSGGTCSHFSALNSAFPAAFFFHWSSVIGEAEHLR